MGGCCKKKYKENQSRLLPNDPDKVSGDVNLYCKPDFDLINSNGTNINNDYNVKVCREDFDAIKLLGRGSFGKVLLVKKKNNNKLFAMKILKKSLIRQKSQEDHTKTERFLLEKIDNPFVISLYYAFQDEIQLYLVTEFVQGGDLFYHLHREGLFSLERAKLYICEIIMALEHLHSLNCIYRDLKPENILLDYDGHIKLTDFGLSKIILKKKKGKAFTICGTPDYLAPEILSEEGYDKSVDWWSLGVIFYEMVTGISPFKMNTKVDLDKHHYSKKLIMPNNLTQELKNFLYTLIEANPKKRLGSGTKGVDNIKNDPFFSDVDWNNVYQKKTKPVFKPKITHPMDLSNFDRCFTNENVNGIQKEVEMPPSLQEHFVGFTYVKNTFDDKTQEKADNL